MSRGQPRAASARSISSFIKISEPGSPGRGFLKRNRPRMSARTESPNAIPTNATSSPKVCVLRVLGRNVDMEMALYLTCHHCCAASAYMCSVSKDSPQSSALDSGNHHRDAARLAGCCSSSRRGRDLTINPGMSKWTARFNQEVSPRRSGPSSCAPVETNPRRCGPRSSSSVRRTGIPFTRSFGAGDIPRKTLTTSRRRFLRSFWRNAGWSASIRSWVR